MRCSCPKCSADISIGLPEIPTEGAYLNCPECSASIHVSRQSFALRALHKSSDITCAACGSEPGSSLHCQNCHVIYPDFLLAETSSATKKQFARLFDRLRPAAASPHGGHEKVTHAQQAPVKKIQLPNKPILLVTMGIVLLVLIGGGGYFYKQYTLEKKYTANFVRAILGLKTAEDFNLKICTKLVNDWKTNPSGPAPRPSSADQASLNRTKNAVDTLFKQLDAPPEKFTGSKAALVKVYDSYSKLHTLTLSPAVAPESMLDSARKIDDEFRKNANELKAGLPETLSAGLNSAKAKYKPLQDF